MKNDATANLHPDLPVEQIADTDPVITSAQSDSRTDRLYIAHRTQDRTPNIYARTKQEGDSVETIIAYGAIDFTGIRPEDGRILDALEDADVDFNDGHFQDITHTIEKTARDTFQTEAEKFHFDDRAGALHDNRLLIEHKDSFHHFLPEDIPANPIIDLYRDWFNSHLDTADTEDWTYDFGYAGTIQFCDFRERAAFLGDATFLTEQEALVHTLAEFGVTQLEISNILDKDKSQVSRQLDNIHDATGGKKARARRTIREIDSVPAHGGSRGNYTTKY